VAILVLLIRERNEMSDYYLDLETYAYKDSPNWIPDFHNDQIISIAYQSVDSKTGQITKPLTILKAWESSEKDILNQFYDIFWNVENKWGFVPIGFNITRYDFLMLISRWNQLLGKHIKITQMFHDRAFVDLYSTGFLCNTGRFIGLDQLVGKQDTGKRIRQWYETKNYSAIEDYIRDEAQSFLSFYAYLIQRLPALWTEFITRTPNSK
jgi:hypothetical protein